MSLIDFNLMAYIYTSALKSNTIRILRNKSLRSVTISFKKNTGHLATVERLVQTYPQN